MTTQSLRRRPVKKLEKPMSHREVMRLQALKRVQREMDKAMGRSPGKGGDDDKAEA